MAMVHETLTEQSRLSRLLTTDFCPWANRFVYWLKEPIGWFALATCVSVMIGLYFSPIGWTLAASLTAIMATGMAWPWIAVRVTQCSLSPQTNAVHEGTPCRMVFSVRNRIPIPVWGLAVEGYLDCEKDGAATDRAMPTVGLACVPPLCTAEYGVNVTPSLRGHYPVSTPQVACSFPFGIWTARRALKEVRALTVWPMVHPIVGVLPIVGLTRADQGDGSRGGRSGDFVGVRSFRRGDSAKHVNWVASARSDALIVTERGGPQSVHLDVVIDTRGHFNREELTRRIRVAASVLASLHQLRIDVCVRLGDERLMYRSDARGRRRMLDALARVPADGASCDWDDDGGIRVGGSHASVLISGAKNGCVTIRINNPTGGRRAGGAIREIVVRPQADLAAAISTLWTEVRDADTAA